MDGETSPMLMWTQNIGSLFQGLFLSEITLAATGWALSLNEMLVILALILIVVDFFFRSDMLTLVAYVLVCIAIARVLQVPVLLQILFGLCAWFGLLWLHYALWRKYLQRLVNTRLAPDRFVPGAGGLVGKHGTIRLVEGKQFAEVMGDLWEYTCVSPVRDGDRIIVVSSKRGILFVSRQGMEE